MRVAITGASGFIGGALARRLLDRGSVTALFRRPDDASADLARLGCRAVFGDLENEPALAQLVREADVVYHCAARMAKHDMSASHRANVAGTANLARAAANAAVGRFVYVSSISVFSASRRPDNSFTEADEPERLESLNVYAFTKYRGEQILKSLCAHSGLPFTILRPTNVYGAGSGPWFWQFARLLRWMPFALGNLAIDVVHVGDLIEALMLASEAPTAVNETFNIGHETVLLRDFITRVGRVVGKDPRPLPDPIDHGLRMVIDRAYRLATRRCMSMSVARSVLYPHTKATQLFGYQPRIRLDDGFASTAEWYRRLTVGEAA